MILKELFNITTKSNDLGFISDLWHLLYICQSVNGLTNFSKWSSFDENFEELMTRLAFENDKRISILYLCYVNKFLSPSIEEASYFDDFKVKDMVKEAYKKQVYQPITDWLQMIQRKEPSYRCFRWNKKLMQLIQNECFKFGGDKEIVLVHLSVSKSNWYIINISDHYDSMVNIIFINFYTVGSCLLSSIDYECSCKIYYSKDDINRISDQINNITGRSSSYVPF